ncbi:unnamed protein product, partial [Adineta steineri]
MSLSPTLHQVCSSDFVHDDFMEAMSGKEPTFGSKSDWTDRAFSRFQLLMDLCRLANQTINATIDRFTMQFIVISNILSENDFNTQINVTLDQLYRSTVADFRFAVDIQRLFVQIDQPYTGKAMESNRYVTNLIIKRNMTYSVNNPQSSQVSFLFTEIYDGNLTLINCGCATNAHCQTSAFMYHDKNFAEDGVYIIPGIVEGCFVINSLLESTLQCLYPDSECFPILFGRVLEG